jgi:hypothetical protein
MRAATQHAQRDNALTGLALVAFARAAKAVESIMPSPSFTALPLHALELQEGCASRLLIATPCRMTASAA